MSEIKVKIKELVDITDELVLKKRSKDLILNNVNSLRQSLDEGKINRGEYNKQIHNLLNVESVEKVIESYDLQIQHLLEKVKLNAYLIYNMLVNIKQLQPSEITSQSPLASFNKDQLIKSLFKKDKRRKDDEFQINLKEVKKFIDNQKKVKKLASPEKEFTVYHSNFYSRFSNHFVDKISFYFLNKYSLYFKKLFNDLNRSDIKILSRTYLNIILFSTIISLPLGIIISYIFTTSILTSLGLGILTMLVTALIGYYYPSSVVKARNKKIKNDLVFAIVHMSAISGSGIQPIKIFKLLLESNEYKGLESDLKKIMNYVNLFGYSLSTALRTTANETPSYELKELLNGMVATIESGGDLKQYLKEKSEEALIQYRLDQRKYTQTLETYSDVYTGILIAAPLLFLVTLAILDKISPTLGGLQITTIATLGTYIGIPLLNILFIVFLNITQTEL